MKLLVCHPRSEDARQMRQSLERIFPACLCVTATNLTEAYHIIEHQEPDCLIFACAFAQNSDFEMLGALVRILEIAGIWWCTPSSSIPELPRTRFEILHEDASDERLKQLITSGLNKPKARQDNTQITPKNDVHDPRRINLIGASTGGVEALTQTLRHFSTSAPPTLIVQHTGAKFAQSLIRLLDGVTPASVVAAKNGMRFESGKIYLSPDADHHLCLSPNGRFEISLVSSDPVSGHRPSVDMLFRSALPFARHVTAALMTGMGRDGAEGLLSLRKAGAHTIVQDRATSVVYGMPRIAVELGAATQQLALGEIGPALVSSRRSRVRT